MDARSGRNGNGHAALLRNTIVRPGDASTFGQPVLGLSIHLLVANDFHLFHWNAPALAEPQL